MVTRILASAIGLLMLTGCNGDSVFSDFDRDFENNQWRRDDVHSYEFDLAQEETCALYFDFSYVDGIVFPDVPVKITISGVGLSSENTIHIKTTDSSGKPLGDCDGDYCDILFPVFETLRMKPGHYTVRVQNEFSYQYLPNVLGVGIKVKRAR